MNTILLLVTYKLKQNTRSIFLDEIHNSGIIENIKQEAGFLRYDYYPDLKDGNTLLLVEEWATEECQQKHLQAPHMNKLKELKELYVLDTSVKKYCSKI
ncbi:putative quinol monooxygenase [Oscillospiraceae bacterium LCP25S3_E10]|nr:antibiotic biosynthesis monooxygenase [Ruminococcus sp.]MDD6446966.1 putative quinol monooxygenase [Ruminococcus sp.]MDY2856352.1 putative quinol monooxygenase [Oscillospiraceae bacterium]